METSRSDIARLFQMLSEAGPWKFEAVPQGSDPLYWVGKRYLEGGSRRSKITLYAGISQPCLSFQVPLVVMVPPRALAAVQDYVLKLNSHIKLAKFSLDDHGHLHLMAELLLETASLATLSAYLEALQNYFEGHIAELEALAQNTELAPLWEGLFIKHLMVDLEEA
jgi:hypothetical protein